MEDGPFAAVKMHFERGLTPLIEAARAKKKSASSPK